MQLSKQLPISATPDAELDCEQEVHEQKENLKDSVSLTKVQLKNLDRYYQDDTPDYNALIRRFNKEKATKNSFSTA